MKYYFAPLEGITDDIYRSLHHRFYGGIDKYFIPFISPTTQLTFSTRELRSVSRQLDAHFNCVPQILTRDADSFVRTAQMLSDLGYAEVNLNLGCPSGTVTGKGKGSAMLKEPDALKPFFDEVFSRCPLKTSVKTRIGFDTPELWDKITDILLSYPFSEVIIHPRTRREFYKGAVHTEAYAAFYNCNQKLPVYNGDLFTPDDISSIKTNFPGTHAVMIGRGLIAAPYLAAGGIEVNTLKSFHDALLKAYLDDRPVNAALGHMSEIWLYMSSCFEDSKKYLKAIQKSRKTDEYTDAVNALFDNCAPKSQPYFSVF